MNLHHVMQVQEMSHHLSESNEGSCDQERGTPFLVGLYKCSWGPSCDYNSQLLPRWCCITKSVAPNSTFISYAYRAASYGGQICLGYRLGSGVLHKSFVFLQPAATHNMFLSWKTPGMQEISQPCKSTSSLCCIGTPKVVCVPGHSGSGGVAPAQWEGTRELTADGVGVLRAGEELHPWFLSSSGFPDIVLMVFCLLHCVFPLSSFCGSFFSQAFDTADSWGACLCILFYLLVSPCSSHHRLMAINTEDIHSSISTGSEARNISFWMPNRHLKLSMYVPLLYLQPSLPRHPAQQPRIHHRILSFSHAVIWSLGICIASTFKTEPESYFLPPSLTTLCLNRSFPPVDCLDSLPTHLPASTFATYNLFRVIFSKCNSHQVTLLLKTPFHPN